VPQQPQNPRPRQGVRSPLQHGSRKRKGDVDRDAAVSKWIARPQGQQGPLHLEAVRTSHAMRAYDADYPQIPARRFRHSRFAILSDPMLLRAGREVYSHWSFAWVKSYINVADRTVPPNETINRYPEILTSSDRRLAPTAVPRVHVHQDLEHLGSLRPQHTQFVPNWLSSLSFPSPQLGPPLPRR
jgi:hypothetical protein